MKRRLVVSPQARSDLADIWSYLASETRLSTVLVMREVRVRFEMLLEFPEAGIKRDELRMGLRSFPADSYVVFYFLSEDGVEIARVLHGRRDIESIFSDK